MENKTAEQLNIDVTSSNAVIKRFMSPTVSGKLFQHSTIKAPFLLKFYIRRIRLRGAVRERLQRRGRSQRSGFGRLLSSLPLSSHSYRFGTS